MSKMSPPWRRRGVGFALGLVALASALGACDALTGPSELERSIALEQKVIGAYAAEVPGIDALTREFAEAWARANEHRDLAVYRSDLKAHAVVAGQKLVAALQAMPTNSDTLKSLHAPLVDAYTTLVRALETFANDDATDVPFKTAYAPVLAAFEALRGAETLYHRGIETWYARNRTTLIPPPVGLTTDKSATP